MSHLISSHTSFPNSHAQPLFFKLLDVILSAYWISDLFSQFSTPWLFRSVIICVNKTFKLVFYVPVPAAFLTASSTWLKPSQSVFCIQYPVASFKVYPSTPPNQTETLLQAGWVELSLAIVTSMMNCNYWCYSNSMSLLRGQITK